MFRCDGAGTIVGADAVISVLGPSRNAPELKITEGTRNIIAAMKKCGVRRLVISTGSAVADPKDEPKIFNRLMNALLNVAARNVYEDMKRTVDVVRALAINPSCCP